MVSFAQSRKLDHYTTLVNRGFRIGSILRFITLRHFVVSVNFIDKIRGSKHEVSKNFMQNKTWTEKIDLTRNEISPENKKKQMFQKMN